jgi:hypothetical protein
LDEKGAGREERRNHVYIRRKARERIRKGEKKEDVWCIIYYFWIFRAAIFMTINVFLLSEHARVGRCILLYVYVCMRVKERMHDGRAA